MSKQEMIAKLERKDLHGVGVKVLYSDGCEIFYFYEDFENNKGVDRASKHFANLINKGKVRKAEYFYKSDCFKTIPCCGCSKMDNCTMRKANI